MDYNLITNIQTCYQNLPPLLYYSHIPTAVVALLVGLFVIWKNKTFEAKLLFVISIAFAFWSFDDIILWKTYSSVTTMFFWSIIPLISDIIIFASFYFLYTFIFKKDLPFVGKLIFFILFLPVILAIPTKINLTNFNVGECLAIEYMPFINYYLAFLGLLVILLISIFTIKQAVCQKDRSGQISIIGFGIFFFLVSFFSTGYFSAILANYNAMNNIAQYGYFGMLIFIGLLAYVIVKFKTFDIKMLAAEALVVGLIILLFSEFFFIGIGNTTVTILISVTIILSTLFGIWLINSVRNEVKRKEELQLMSGKLSEANDQLRRLDNSKSEFISIASHQLRTPLTAIKGFVSLLLEGSYGKIDPKQGEVLNKVYSSNERMVNLVEDLLNVSRMESGRMEFKFTPCKVDDICQEVIDTFYPKAKNLGLYLDYKKPETALPEVMIDGTKVREVISNLVDNALKYTPKGGVTLKVEKITENIRVTVSDTGIGVPATELPYLFAKFSRGKDISRLNTGGTGLGLFVGKSMIEQNGGKIWAESDGEGKGSRFIIEIPLQQSKELMERWG